MNKDAAWLIILVGLLAVGLFLSRAPRVINVLTETTEARSEYRIENSELLGESITDVSLEGIVDQSGTPVSWSRYADRPLVIGFMYLNCPEADMCPLFTGQMMTLQERVAEKKLQPQFVSITIDPERDRPEDLREYGEVRGVEFRNWDFWTGETSSIDRIADELDLVVNRSPEEDVDLQHNLRLVITDANHDIQQIWRGSEWDIEDVWSSMKKTLPVEEQP